MKLFILPILLFVVFTLSNPAPFEKNGQEKEPIPRMMKGKDDHPTTQKYERYEHPAFTIYINNKIYKPKNGEGLGRLLYFRTNDFDVVDDEKGGKLLYFNITNPDDFKDMPYNETAKKQPEELDLPAAEVDKKPEISGERYDKLQLNEMSPEMFELDANYTKDLELKEQSKFANDTHELVVNGMSRVFNVTKPDYFIEELDNGFETKNNKSEEFGSTVKESAKKIEFLGESYNNLISNEKFREKLESDGNVQDDFASRSDAKDLKLEDENILVQEEGGKHPVEFDSNTSNSEKISNPLFKSFKKIPGELKSNEVIDKGHGNNSESFELKEKRPEIIESKDHHAAEIGNPTYIPEKKEYPEIYQEHEEIKTAEPQESDIPKWEEKQFGVYDTSNSLKFIPLHLKHFLNFEKEGKYQNLDKSKIPFLEDMESFKINPRIKDFLRVTENYPKNANFVHGSKHFFDFGPLRRFSELNGSNKLQEKREGEKLTETFIKKFEPQEIHSSAFDLQEKHSGEIKSLGKHSKFESKKNHFSFEKPNSETKIHILNSNKSKEKNEELTTQYSTGLESQETYSQGFKQENDSSAFETKQVYPDKFKLTAQYPAFRLTANNMNVSVTIRETEMIYTKRGENLNHAKRVKLNAANNKERRVIIDIGVKHPQKYDNDSNKVNASGVEIYTDIELEIRMTKQKNEQLTTQYSIDVESQETYSRGLKLQENDSSAFKKVYPDKFEPTANYSTVRLKGKHMNASMTMREIFTKIGENSYPTKKIRLSAVSDNELMVKIPIHVPKYPHKHDNDSNKVNTSSDGKFTDIELEMHITVLYPPMEYKTRESKDKLTNEANEYNKNISEDHYTSNDKTENREKLTEGETSRYNENNIVHKSSSFTKPISVPREIRKRRSSHKSVDLVKDISLDEYKSTNVQKSNLKTAISVPKPEPKSGTENDTNKESKHYEITTEKTTLEVENQQTNNVTTEETVKESDTLSDGAENATLMHSESGKEKITDTNNSEAKKNGEIKYGHNQHSEKFATLSGDNEMYSSELKYDSNTSTLNNTKKEMTFENQNATSTKPIQEVSEDNINETKKGSRTSSATKKDHLLMNENNTDTSKLDKKLSKNEQYRQSNEMTTEGIVQENITINDSESILKMNNNTENIFLNDESTEIKKSEGKDLTVLRDDSKTTNGATPLTDINNTDKKGKIDQTTSGNSGVHFIRKGNNAAAKTLIETATRPTHEQGAIMTESTRNIEENSTAIIEAFVWTGLDGMYNSTSLEDKYAGIRKQFPYRHPESMVSVQEPTTNEDRNSDVSIDKPLKNETQKQAMKKEFELVGYRRSENYNEATPSGYSMADGENSDVSHVNQPLKSTTKTGNSSKGIKYQHSKEMKKEEEKVTGISLSPNIGAELKDAAYHSMTEGNN